MFGDITESIRIGDIDTLKVVKGTSITESQTTIGSIPVVGAGIKPAYYHNISNREKDIITISASGANAGFINFWNCPIFASDCNTIQSIDKQESNIIFVYYAMLEKQKLLFDTQKGNAQPHVYSYDIENIRIPVVNIDLQNSFGEIVEEIDKLKFESVKCVIVYFLSCFNSI